MEIRVLRYFLAVVREGGINRAAEVLHITQPTLSRQIAHLEEETGARLFRRDSRKLSLTDEGWLLKRRAEEIIELVDRTGKELAEQDKLVEGKIVIGIGELGAVQTVSRMIAEFHKKYPQVTYELFTANTSMIREQMEKGLIDIGVLLEPASLDRFDFVRLKEKERWCVLMRPDDPLAEREKVSVEDLKNVTLILPRRPAIQSSLFRWLGNTLREEQILFVSNLTTNAAVMVQQGLGNALVIEGSLPCWDKNKIIFRPLEPELTDDCVLAWKKGQPLSSAVSRFIEEIQYLLSIEKDNEISI